MTVAEERETIIRFDEGADTALVYTSTPRVCRLLEARGLKAFKVDVGPDGKARGWYYQVPRQAIIIKPDRCGIKVGGTQKPRISSRNPQEAGAETPI